MAELPMVGEEFAGYRLRSVLGRGGMSVVYQAENPRLGSVIALKVLAPELAVNDTFRARFLEESRIAASLNHPNVIPIYDTGSYGGLLYIAMRYVSGTDLRQMLKKRGRLIPYAALSLTAQAARALDAAHRRGLVHRDVKPGNLLIERGDDDDDPDHVYLADFGITKHAMDRTGMTASGQFLGTVDYVAPEQIQGEPATPASDVYALTGVLYECLTGEVPFPKPTEAATLHAHVIHPPPTVSERRPDLPPALDGVIAQGMAKDPWSRPALAAELIQAASRALSSSAPSIAVPPEAPRRDGAAAERDRQVQATKVPVAGSVPAVEPIGAGSTDPRAAAGITRAVARPRVEPAAPAGEVASAGTPTRGAGLPPRVLALVAGLTLAAFAAGFVLGLIVH